MAEAFTGAFFQNPMADPPLKGPAKLDVGSAVGVPGSLTVLKDLCLKEPSSPERFLQVREGCCLPWYS